VYVAKVGAGERRVLARPARLGEGLAPLGATGYFLLGFFGVTGRILFVFLSLFGKHGFQCL
jgi:hypothetical protein